VYFQGLNAVDRSNEIRESEKVSIFATVLLINTSWVYNSLLSLERGTHKPYVLPVCTNRKYGLPT